MKDIQVSQIEQRLGLDHLNYELVNFQVMINRKVDALWVRYNIITGMRCEFKKSYQELELSNLQQDIENCKMYKHAHRTMNLEMYEILDQIDTINKELKILYNK